MRHPTARAVLGGLLLAALAAAPARAALYQVVDLGSLGGLPGAGAVALNGQGESVGYSFVPGGLVHAMLNRSGTVIDLGTLGGTQSLARAVNRQGDVVGWAYRTGETSPRAFLWRAGVMSDLGTFGGARSDANDINTAGAVVGSAFDAAGRERAFYWTGGALQDVGTLGGSQARANAINDWGDIVGMAAPPGDDRFHAFLAKPGSPLVDLGTLGGFTSYAYDVNASTGICGWSQISFSNPDSRGFFWTNGVLKSIGTLGGFYSAAFGLNDAGDLVGASTRSDGSMAAVIWRQNQLTDLNTLIPAGSGWNLYRAWDIDENGVIVGEGISPGGEQRPFLLAPAALADAQDGGVRELALAAASPNPARFGTTLRFTLPERAAIRLDVHDVRGARVRTLAEGDAAAGEHARPWDLRDAQGAAVPPGLYWARLQLGGRVLTRSLVVAR